MASLNALISVYTSHLQQGELQTAYKGILDSISLLRAHFIRKYPDCDVGGIYQGYMDMSYFSLSPKTLREQGLKIAIVYLHAKGVFEVWLSARNRGLSKKYDAIRCHSFPDMTVFHDDTNLDSIIECTLTASPDFENHAKLTNIIVQGVEEFLAAIVSLI